MVVSARVVVGLCAQDVDSSVPVAVDPLSDSVAASTERCVAGYGIGSAIIAVSVFTAVTVIVAHSVVIAVIASVVVPVRAIVAAVRAIVVPVRTIAAVRS